MSPQDIQCVVHRVEHPLNHGTWVKNLPESDVAILGTLSFAS